MKRLLICAAILPLSACASLGDGNSAVAEKVLGNLEHCRRSYTAIIGALGVPGGSLSIECPAKPFDPPPPGMSDLKVVVEP